MLICSIDTSGRDGSLALLAYDGDATPGASFDGAKLRVLEFATLKGREYSAQLIPTLQQALEKHSIAKSEIGLFVVVHGPGSFTGLRVALSTVKALASTLRKPVVAVSMLEALALASGRQGKVVAAVDAQRGEVFSGEYDIADSNGAYPVRTQHEALASVDDFCTWLSARIPVPVTFTPDETIAEKVRTAGSPAEVIARPGADVVGRAGVMKFLAGKTTAPEDLDANYIRRSDAEIAMKR
jgi:tRNA threonylcarbamoyladenosine biosynthesis protein TsaB